MSRSLLRAMIGASLLVLVAVGPGVGHAELSSASPGPGDVVSVVPPELVASFTQDMREDRTKIELRDASGRVIAQGGRDPDRPRVQEMVLPPLAPGVYEVRWVTFSAEDDELHRGKYTFTVLEASLPTSIPEPTACPSPASTATAPTASEGPRASSSLCGRGRDPLAVAHSLPGRKHDRSVGVTRADRIDLRLSRPLTRSERLILRWRTRLPLAVSRSSVPRRWRWWRYLRPYPRTRSSLGPIHRCRSRSTSGEPRWPWRCRSSSHSSMTAAGDRLSLRTCAVCRGRSSSSYAPSGCWHGAGWSPSSSWGARRAPRSVRSSPGSTAGWASPS